MEMSELPLQHHWLFSCQAAGMLEVNLKMLCYFFISTYYVIYFSKKEETALDLRDLYSSTALEVSA